MAIEKSVSTLISEHALSQIAIQSKDFHFEFYPQDSEKFEFKSKGVLFRSLRIQASNQDEKIRPLARVFCEMFFEFFVYVNHYAENEDEMMEIHDWIMKEFLGLRIAHLGRESFMRYHGTEFLDELDGIMSCRMIFGLPWEYRTKPI